MSAASLLLTEGTALLYSPAGVLLALIAAVVYVVHRYTLDRRAAIPTVRPWHWIVPDVLNRLSFHFQAPRLIREGYHKHPENPFQILKPGGRPLLIIPYRYAEELRSIHSKRLSVREAFAANFGSNLGDYTTILDSSDIYNSVLQRRMLPAIPRILPSLIDEVDYAFGQELPCPQDGSWLRARPHTVLLGLISRTGSRIFVGPSICRDPSFLEMTVSLTTNLFMSVAILGMVPWLLRPLVATFLGSVRRLNGQLEYIKHRLGREIERRRAVAAAAADQKAEPEHHDDFLAWADQTATAPHDKDPVAIAHMTAAMLSMAVVHTSAMAVTHILYDLVARPDVLQRLVDEQHALLPGGWSTISQDAMLKMPLLDSVMRESQRFNPTGETSFARLVKDPITLSDGFTLQPGQQIGIPAKLINQSGPGMDTYDAFRWAADPSPTSSWVHSGPRNLHFGFGRYACPGRFLAAYQVKAILSRLLLEHEWRLEDGSCVRPANFVVGDKIVPDFNRHLLFRRKGQKA